MDIYKCPSNDFQKLTNKIWELNIKKQQGKSRADVQESATKLWHAKYKNDRRSLAEFMSQDVESKQSILKYFSVKQKSSDQSVADEPTPSHERSPISNAAGQGTCPKATNTSGVRFDQSRQYTFNTESRLQLIRSFLADLELNPSDILTIDVVNAPSFISPLWDIAATYFLYMETLTDYLQLYPKRKTATKITANENVIDSAVSNLKTHFARVSKLRLNDISKGILQTAVEKAALLKQMVLCFEQLKTVIDDQLCRIRVQISQKKASLDSLPNYSQFHLHCRNDGSLSWEQAFSNLIQEQTGKFPGPFSFSDIISCGKAIMETNALSIDHLLQSELGKSGCTYLLKRCLSQNLMEWLPVIIVQKGFRIVVVNIHELYITLTDTFFEELVNLDIDIKPSTFCPENSVSSSTVTTKPGPKPGTGGRPPKHVQFPTVVSESVQFLKLHGFAAHCRRRNDTATSLGVSVPELRKHLLKTIPGLKDANISLSTVKRLMVPPNKSLSSAKYYKGLVDARVPGKSNSATCGEHKDLHFQRAQIAMASEMAGFFTSECLQFSCDDKNKVNVGTLAVSRYHQINKLFPTNDSPNYYDHDFPFSNSKIIPSGYLLIKPKQRQKRSKHSRSWSLERRNRCVESDSTTHRSQSAPACRRESTTKGSDYNVDKLGRLHVRRNRSGPLYVFNRAACFHSSTAMTHANDLYFILQDPSVLGNKNAVVDITDGGPDWSSKSQYTLMYQGRLWRDLGLDYLAVINHAPGHSAENPIEHKWSPLSKMLVSVTLPNTLPGESKPPCQQSNLSGAEKSEKNADVFDNAIAMLNDFWRKDHDGFPIIPVPVPCRKTNTPYNDHDDVEKLFKKGIREIRATPVLESLRHEYIFLLKHCVRRTYMIEFVKCNNPMCSHCSLKPIKATTLMSYIESMGNKLPTPTLSTVHSGHYMTFLEVTNHIKHLKQPAQGPDVGCPSLSEVKLCPRGCMYVISSKTDGERHEQLVHYTERQNELQTKRRERKRNASETSSCDWVCKFRVADGVQCQFSCNTYYGLRKHKQEKQHLERIHTRKTTSSVSTNNGRGK